MGLQKATITRYFLYIATGIRRTAVALGVCLFLILISMVALPLIAGDAVTSGEMTKAERDYLIAELTSSKDGLLSSIKDLTLAQWVFKPSPDVWSVEECTEHLILAEAALLADEQGIMRKPAGTRLANANTEGDRRIVAQMKDRSSKAKAPAAIVPTGRFATPTSAAAEFSARRDKTIAYVKTTRDALRLHSGEGPTGSIADAYQILLMMAAHTARHTAQINEVKANAAFATASDH